MPLKKSPGGSIFPYYYKGGELFGAHYGSFFENEEALLKRIQAEEQFLLETTRKLPYWIDFYETKLTDRILVEFLKSIDRLKGHITKLAIVGCSSRDRRRLQQLAKKAGVGFAMPLRFFGDPEEAKTWLVSEAA